MNGKVEDKLKRTSSPYDRNLFRLSASVSPGASFNRTLAKLPMPSD